eukprot:comp16287_c0_seq1/m.14053 comp16287_c0_seq1/g.14053  ORF comp16287_c0_seq1/g.14053 comp16287_c0_seq1/m.14053 type:complete len:193 (-) comp16287_c0_seq1:230-808(-)
MGLCGSCCLSSERQEQLRMEALPKVVLDTKFMGSDCVVVKNGLRLCGSGGVLANAPLVQNKSYFEMKLQATGRWGLGVATRQEDLEKLPLGASDRSWVLRSDGAVVHNGETYSVVDGPAFQEGDVLACSYDHVELQFFHNGRNLNCPVMTVRGHIYPVFYVDDGAIVDVAFRDFTHQPPMGYDQIMFEQSIL